MYSGEIFDFWFACSTNNHRRSQVPRFRRTESKLQEKDPQGEILTARMWHYGKNQIEVGQTYSNRQIHLQPIHAVRIEYLSDEQAHRLSMDKISGLL